MNTATENVSTDMLRTGDVVHVHGMRLEIDREITTYTDRGAVYRTLARVTNLPDVLAEAFIPAAWLYHHTERWEDGKGWTRDNATTAPDDARWTIQGNELATWLREVRV